MDKAALRRAFEIGWEALQRHPIAASIDSENVWRGTQKIAGGWIVTVLQRVVPTTPDHVIVRVLVEDGSDATFIHPKDDPGIYETVERFRRNATLRNEGDGSLN